MRLHPSELANRFSVSFGLLILMFSVLWLAGGASRPDVLGRPISGGIAWLALVIAIACGERPTLRKAKVPAGLLCLAIALPLLQLIPLPTPLWQVLPGREAFMEAVRAAGVAQPWRPWSIAPSATLNAVTSLVVPAATMFLFASLRAKEKAIAPAILLGMIVASTIVGLLQASGAGFGNALINGTPGDVSGTFANRNHFALFMCVGCVLLPVWLFSQGRSARWRGPLAVIIGILFVLTVLATGSRAGLGLCALAILMGILLGYQGLRRELRRAPKWMLPALIIAMLAVIASFVAISIAADRAESFSRLLAIDASGDTRVRATPTVIGMVFKYFPAGTGFGSFDPMFRLNEPFDMLKPTYFNHAHNDFLEVVLDGGVAGLLLLLAAAGWWAYMSVQAWRARSGASTTLARAGSAILLLVMAASIVDYPARTPMIMAMVVIAALWLADIDAHDRGERPRDALPA